MNILISKINYVGDMMSFLPTLSAVSQHMPAAGIVMVCTPIGREIAEPILPQATFVTLSYWEARSRGRILGALRRARSACLPYECAMSLHSYDEPSFSYILAASLGVPSRIGFDTGITRFQFLLTEALPFDLSKSIVDVNFELARRATGISEAAPERTPIAYSEEDRESIVRKLGEVDIAPDSEFIAIHCGAKLSYREWGIEKFAQLGHGLEQGLGLPVVFIEDGTRRLAECRRVVATASLTELGCLLDLASLFIGNNSGPMHIAGAMGTPCVVIQGPTAKNWEHFWREVPHKIIKANHLACIPCERPGANPGRCLNKRYPRGCMKEITVDMVEESVAELLCCIGSGKSER